MKKRFVMVTVLCAMGIGFTALASGSIQPAMDNVYGHAITLNEGVTGVFDNSMSEATFLSQVFATDAQGTNYMTWTQNEADGRCLILSSSNNWPDGAVTFKFVAPAGQTFSGGTVNFTGGGIWGSSTFEMKASSAYGNDGWGVLANQGTIYSEDAHTFNQEWASDTWTVNVPSGVSEFYVSVAARVDWHTTWGQSCYADVTLVPEPATMILLCLGGVFTMIRKRK